MFVRPIRRFVLLLDEQPEVIEGGVVVRRERGVGRHDFPVVRVGEAENVDFGQGDIVVLEDPNAGRRIMLDGIVYRLVRVRDIIAIVDEEKSHER